jgi:hypothetical protein
MEARGAASAAAREAGAAAVGEVAKPVKDLRVLFVRIDQSFVFEEAIWQQVFDNLNTLKDKQERPIPCRLLIHALNATSYEHFKDGCAKLTVPVGMVHYLNDFMDDFGLHDEMWMLLQIIEEEHGRQERKRLGINHKIPSLLPDMTQKINDSFQDLKKRYPTLSDERLLSILKKEAAACFAFKTAQAAHEPDSTICLCPLNETQKWVFKSMPAIPWAPFSPLMHYLTVKKQEGLIAGLQRRRLLEELYKWGVLRTCFGEFFAGSDQEIQVRLQADPVQQFFRCSRFPYEVRQTLKTKQIDSRQNKHAGGTEGVSFVRQVEYFNAAIQAYREECNALRKKVEKAWKLQQKAMQPTPDSADAREAQKRLLNDLLLRKKEQVKESLERELKQLIFSKLRLERFTYEEVNRPPRLHGRVWTEDLLSRLEFYINTNAVLPTIIPEYKIFEENFKRDYESLRKDAEKQFNAFYRAQTTNELNDQLAQLSYSVFQLRIQCDQACEKLHRNWITSQVQQAAAAVQRLAPDRGAPHGSGRLVSSFFLPRPEPVHVSPVNASSAPPAGRSQLSGGSARLLAAHAASADRGAATDTATVRGGGYSSVSPLPLPLSPEDDPHRFGLGRSMPS